MLRVEHLTKVYDDGTVALNDVTFDVPDGQFLAVIGLSGSGKSTLLRCINRLIDPTDGRILWNGEDITAASQEDMRRIRRRIGMVFQHFNLVHRSKVITNVLAGRLGYTPPALALVNRFSKADRERAMAQLARV
ncbi:MAG: ATP-binding cassette domain-containing protein, partial [Acidimicrobiia bacterium]